MILPPGDGGSLVRKIKANATETGFSEHAAEQAPTTADVENRPPIFHALHGATYESDMIAQNHSAVKFLGGEGGADVRLEPVGVRIELGEFRWSWPRVQPDEAATLALHHVERLVGRVIQPIGSTKQLAVLPAVAGRARLT